MATVECRCSDSIEITGSNSKVYLTPTYSSGVGEVLILDRTQARKLQAEIVKAMAEPEAAKPESLSIEDEEEDEITVGLETRGGSLVVEVGISDSDEDETYAVWLTEAQTEELTGALEAHKKYVTQENAKPKPVSSTIFDFPMPSGYGVIDWSVSPIGYGVVSRGTIEIPSPDEAPKAKAKAKAKAQTWTLTINLKE